MTSRSIDELRAELKNLGYLSHGLERWFARDPWTSRTFWAELGLVCSKASFLLAVFATIPMTFVVLRRNGSASVGDGLVVAALDLVAVFAITFAVLVLTALVLRMRPALAIESPTALMAIAMMASGVVAIAVGVWWLGFEEAPVVAESIVFVLMLGLLFVVGSIIVSAALLSFSIHETRRIPSIHRRSRTLPIAATGVVLLACLLVPVWLVRQRGADEPPAQVVVRPTNARVALVAVEGMTLDMFHARADLAEIFATSSALAPVREWSPAAIWATIGTGTDGSVHGVRAVDGVAISGSGHILQATSRFDVVLRGLAPAIGLARRQPLPPSVRRRNYVWEELAERGLTAVAVNWWASDDRVSSNMASVGQQSIFRAAASDESASDPRSMALAVDRIAIERFERLVSERAPRFATVDLPGLDVLLNRIDLDDTTRVAASLSALESITRVAAMLREGGFDVVLIGVPGVAQTGDGVMAWTMDFPLSNAGAADVAPSLLDLYGFPATVEMSGHSLVRGSTQGRIKSYGPREAGHESPATDEEYYESLRSLGYIQ